MNKLLAQTLLALTFTAACASSGFTPSRHYAEVTKHLDLGGDLLLYSDVDGDLAAGADFADRWLERMSKRHPRLKLDRIQAKRILRQLGLDQVLALGLSSARDGKAFHNKAFLEYGKERRGLLLLTGAAPRELEVPRQAPADVDVVFESEIKLKSLVSLVETIANDIAGKEAREIFAGLDEKLPGVSLSVRDVLGRLDTRLVGVLRVDERRAFTVPDKKKAITVPGFDALLSVDDLAILFDAYRGVLQALPNVTSTLEGDMQWLEIEVAVPGAAWLKPVLGKNLKSGRIFLATNKAFVKEFQAEKPGGRKALAQAADWKRATARFETKANALSYVSGAFMGKLARFLRPLGNDDEDVQMGIDIVLELLPEGGIPMAVQQVSLADGLYCTSYATTSHKSTLFPALVAGPMALAGTVVGAASAFSRYSRRAASRASLGQAGTEPSEDDEEVIGEGDEGGEADIDRAPVPLGGPFRGAARPTVSIVELSDFQCPFCARLQPTLQKLLEQYPQGVRIYFRHHPLPFHQDAHLAAQAAMAAHAQGKFWQMHDKLFANYQNLKRADLEGYAKVIGLDMARFRSALDQGTYRQAVDEDIALATRLGSSGTPSCFINGRSLVGAQPFEKWKEMVDDEIMREAQAEVE